MIQRSRRALIFFFVGFVLLLGALVVSLDTLVDRNREDIRNEMQRALGRSISFDGVGLDLWNGLGLVATNLQIADDPRFAATPLLQTKQVNMKVRWLPLLTGKIQIKKFILGEPEIQIIRNEQGRFNLFALGKPIPGSKSEGEAYSTESPPPVGFSLSGVEVRNGKIHYVDRSTQQPVEIRLQNLDLDLYALALTQTAKVKLKATLLEGNTQNVTLEGWVGPLTSVKEWTEYHLDLQMGIDSLLVPQLTSAVPALHDKVPSYLDISGPLKLRTKVLGTVSQPHLTGLNLQGAVFGAQANNLAIQADVELTDGELNRNTQLKGRVVLEPVTLDKIKNVPVVESYLPAQLTSKGPIGIVSDIQGSLQDLKVNTSIMADESDVGFGNWLKKPKGVPAKIVVRIAHKNDRTTLDQSTLSLYNLNMDVSGSMEKSPERLLRLRVRTDAVKLDGWDKLLPRVSNYELKGEAGFNLAINTMQSPQGDNVDIRGLLSLNKVSIKDRKTGRRVDQIASKVIFKGKEAEVEKLQIKLGSSNFTVQGVLENFSSPMFRYRLSSSKVNLADLTQRPEYKSDWAKGITSEGELRLADGTPTVEAEITLAEGSLQELPYKNLNGIIAWRPDKLGIEDLNFQALGGDFQGNGSWTLGNGKNPNFTFRPHIKGMDLTQLLPRLSPEFGKGVQGSLNLAAELKGSGTEWENVRKTLKGQGHAQIVKGSLKELNLVKKVLAQVTGLPGVKNLVSSKPSPQYARIIERKDTPFDTLEATFHLKEDQIQTENLLLAAPEYLIHAKGKIGLDKTMGWKATLALSPTLSREFTQEHKNVRFLVDDQGRLGVPFHLIGNLPRVEPKPDNKRLSELIQKGMAQNGDEVTPKDEKSGNGKLDQDWIRKGIEQLLGK